MLFQLASAPDANHLFPRLASAIAARKALPHWQVLGWPFFTLECELGAREPVIARKVWEVESAVLHYFESAIRDAIAQEAIEPCDPRAEALSLRAAMYGILASARKLNDSDELGPLTAFADQGVAPEPEEKAMATAASGRFSSDPHYRRVREGSPAG